MAKNSAPFSDFDPRPLAGVKVLDFTSVMAGPYCTRLLADLGADVIKVEPPEGDYLRVRPPMNGERSAYFGHLNCGKRSIVVDMKQPGAAALLNALVVACDVVVENFRPGVMTRLGMGYDTLAKINPRLVYCSISGYGQAGPGSQKPAYAPIVHAMSGHELAQLDCQRSQDGARPQQIGVFTGDVMSGLYAFGAIQSALLQRQATGCGQLVDVSLLESMMNLLIYEFQNVQFPSNVKRPVYGPLKCTDGFVIIQPTTQKLFEAFCKVIGRPELLDDTRFSSAGPRSVNWDQLMDEAQRWTESHSAEECERAFDAGGVPCTRYRTVADLFQDEQLAYRGAIQEAHDRGGRFKVTAPPFQLNGKSPRPAGPVPDLGEHTEEVLRDVAGISSSQIVQLRASGVLG